MQTEFNYIELHLHIFTSLHFTFDFEIDVDICSYANAYVKILDLYVYLGLHSYFFNTYLQEYGILYRRRIRLAQVRHDQPRLARKSPHSESLPEV